MKVLCVALLSCFALTWANEDLMRDFLKGTLADEVDKRALVNAMGSSLKSAASGFWNSIGSKKALGSVSRNIQLEDSCLNQGTPISRFPTNPWSGSILKGGIKGISGISKSIGKRAEEKSANKDIIFVLDTSGSIPQDQFDKAKTAISILVESFCPSTFGNAVTTSGNKQIALVLFGSSQTTEVSFDDSAKGLGFVQDKILSMKHRREGSTGTTDALKYVRTKVLGKGRSRLNNDKVATDVIVITDGQCNRNCRSLGVEAANIRKMGVNVFAMGVANARACELEIISGEGTKLAYGLGDLRNFERFAQAVKEIADERGNSCA